MATKDEQTNAQEMLREMFPKGSTVPLVLRYTSRTGMSRAISVLHAGPDGIEDVSWMVARALNWKLDRNNGGVKVNGVGMDMGFHLVYTLAQTLYGTEDKGGYALTSRWI